MKPPKLASKYGRSTAAADVVRWRLDGVVRYVGARDECVRRAKILVVASDRRVQDVMLGRALLTS
jgi:hypothetical protein